MSLDPRLNAFRDDLADIRLKGQVQARRYAEGRRARVVAPVLDLRHAPDPGAGLDTQLLAGDEVLVFEESGGFAWIQSLRDHYVGYAPMDGIGPDMPSLTHRVRVPRTFVYREPDMKTPARQALSLGCAVRIPGTVETRGTVYALLDDGSAIVADHLRPLGEMDDDFVAVAEGLERTPYLWGGTSAFGIDCSGLVQLSMRMTGRTVPRDTDMQAQGLGERLDIGTGLTGLRRGDLVFWQGHIAIMTDDRHVIHANGRTMMVSREPLAGAIERIAALYGRPTVFRRP